MSLNTSFSLFIPYTSGILCRKYGQLLFLLLAIFVCRSSSELSYNVGDYKVECPNTNWINVDGHCFLVVDDNVYSWKEAQVMCAKSDNQQSYPIQQANWFLNRDLAIKVKATSPKTLEFWTALSIQYQNAENLPPEIQVANSLSTVNMYNPMWKELQPQINLTTQEPTQVCISINMDLNSSSSYGWKLLDCNSELPLICETFGCLQDTFRCRDNSACVTKKSICDGIQDCADNSDEKDCSCDCSRLQSNSDSTYGSIQAADNVEHACKTTDCSWQVKQVPGSRVTFNLLSMEDSNNGQLIIDGVDSGEQFLLSGQGPVSVQTSGSHLRVRYASNSTKHKRLSGFHLQYIGENSTSCVQRFSSWNGTFSPPMHIHRTDKYRSSTDCFWIIENREQKPITVQIPVFKLAVGDYFLIYDGTAEDTNLMGNYSSKNEPPTLFISMQKEISFRFWTSPKTPGNIGFRVFFERTCMDLHPIKQEYGIVQTPSFGQLSTHQPFECSWIIDVPCKHGICALTIYFDSLNITNSDLITVYSDDNVLILDGTNLPTNFRTRSKTVFLEIHAQSKQFSSRFIYSGDCPASTLSNALPKDESKALFGFREQSEFVCNDQEQSEFSATCSLASKWTTSSECSAAVFGKFESTKQCVVKSILNGWITELDRQTGKLTFECSKGFKASPSNTVTCKNGQWSSSEPKCEGKY